MSRESKILAEYNHLWSAGEIAEPLNVLVGGNIGTGKSTFTELLAKHLQHVNVLPTGIVRSVLQSLDLQTVAPELYGHSYELGKHVDEPSLSEIQKAVVAFERQLLLVDKAIRNILAFSKTEGQQYILDGNHVMPSTVAELQQTSNLIGLFFKTTSIDQYRKNVSGPTHQRQLTESQFEIVRALHDYIVEEAQKHNLPVFEYTEQEEALVYVSSQVALIIERNHGETRK